MPLKKPLAKRPKKVQVYSPWQKKLVVRGRRRKITEKTEIRAMAHKLLRAINEIKEHELRALYDYKSHLNSEDFDRAEGMEPEIRKIEVKYGLEWKTIFAYLRDTGRMNKYV